MTKPATSGQITLPGQAHTAEGPHDQTGMYVMHHAFRRDLDDFVAAVRNTPLGEAETWQALGRRWATFDEILHHHHQIEDASIWPVLLAHADAAGSAEDRATLEAMEAEHSVIDPALAGCRTGFADLLGHPCAEHRDALESRLSALRESLAEHLRHEEADALPLLQRTMTVEEWAAAEKYAGKAYPKRMLAFLVPWGMDRLPVDARDRMLSELGPVYGLMYRLTRGRYERRQRAAFRYA